MDLAYPPWGLMDKDCLFDIKDRPVPNHFRRLDGSMASNGEWEALREDILDKLSSMLWPRWDFNSDTWVGTAAARIDSLNDADLSLLSTFKNHLDNAVGGRGNTQATHLTFFEEEDDPPPNQLGMGIGYERYDPSFNPASSGQWNSLLFEAVAKKIGSVTLQFKQQLQRPRPYQIALMLKQQNFVYRYAVSAATPSMISGHCLQGCLAGCNAYAGLKIDVRSPSFDILKKFTVDIGDRRVFAGLHFPSDNLSSWYTALRLIPHVFEASIAVKIKSFLSDAICHQSVVYEAISKFKPTAGISPYSSMMNALDAELVR